MPLGGGIRATPDQLLSLGVAAVLVVAVHLLSVAHRDRPRHARRQRESAACRRRRRRSAPRHPHRLAAWRGTRLHRRHQRRAAGPDPAADGAGPAAAAVRRRHPRRHRLGSGGHARRPDRRPVGSVRGPARRRGMARRRRLRHPRRWCCCCARRASSGGRNEPRPCQLRRILPDHGADLRRHLPRPQRAVGPDRPVQRRHRRLRRGRRLCFGAADHARRPKPLRRLRPSHRRRLDRRRARHRPRVFPDRRADYQAARRLSRHRHFRRRRRRAACRAQPRTRHRRPLRHRLHPASLRGPSRRSAYLQPRQSRRSGRQSCCCSTSCWSGSRAARGAGCSAPSARTSRPHSRSARTP